MVGSIATYNLATTGAAPLEGDFRRLDTCPVNPANRQIADAGKLTRKARGHTNCDRRLKISAQSLFFNISQFVRQNLTGTFLRCIPLTRSTLTKV